MKKRLFKILAVVMAVALGSTAALAAVVPSDVKGKDWEAAVTKLVEESIVTGDTDGLYHGEKNLNRAEVSTLIAKSADPKAAESTAKSGFTDMAGYGWAEPFVGLMADRKIAKGYPDGTFQPGANVKICELAAFVIRSCGFNDEDLDGSWPQNYMKKADEMDLFDAVKGKDRTSMLDPEEPATKGQAAIAVFNALDQIREAQKPEESEWIFDRVSFSSDLKELNGIPVSEDVKVYSYGKAGDYSESMKMPDVKKLPVQSPANYAGVTTNGFYRTAGGEVTKVLLPADQGFSGRVLGVITGYFYTVNGNGDEVLGIETTAAGRRADWICRKGVKEEQIEPMIAKIPAGDLLVITVNRGQVSAMAVASPADLKHFAELSGDGWTEVLEVNADEGWLKLDGDPDDSYIGYAENPLVYVMNKDGTDYDVESVGSIRKGYLVRCYDTTDDKEDEANIIFVKKK